MPVKFCPNCESENVFVFGYAWKCGDCGYLSMVFPEKEKNKDEPEKDLDEKKQK